MSSQSHKSKLLTLAVVLSAVLGALLLASAVYCTRRMKKWSRGNGSINEENVADSTKEDEMELLLFDLVSIQAAAKNFSNENKVGEGGFGDVYKGKIGEGHEVAVKRLQNLCTRSG